MLRRCVQKNASLVRLLSTGVKSRWPGWELVVGIEVHAQIKSRAKLFSHAWTSTYDEDPNIHADAFDAAFPGTLPKLNSSCVDLAVRTALALESNIQRRSTFDRKHYFYSDLPSGYQITQRYAPLAKGGRLKLPQSGINVTIDQIQLEQDTAKTNYDSQSAGSIIDLNRAGSALMEIVSNPDMSTPEQAGEYVRTLQTMLRSVATSDGSMEQGSMRCDVNVSVNRTGEPKGTRCEIKNLNSVRFLMSAIISEALRHISVIESGGEVLQETRGFDEQKAETYSMRNKEDSPDYRYMPDPNLPPLILEKDYINAIRQSKPELPEEIKARLLARGLSERDADFLMSLNGGRDVLFDGQLGKNWLSFFEEVSQDRDAKAAINWIANDLYGLLAARHETFKDNVVTAEQLRELINLVDKGAITVTSAKHLLKHMMEQRSTASPESVAKEQGLLALTAADSGDDFLSAICQDALSSLPEEADAVRSGNQRVLNKLVGFVMKKSKGRVDAQTTRERLKELLSS